MEKLICLILVSWCFIGPGNTMKYILFAIFILITPVRVLAAEIFFGTHAKEIGIGQKFEIGVLLNADGEEINAIEGAILFPHDILEAQEVYEGGSIVNFWIKKPIVSSVARESGKLSFSGVIPGGVTGKKGYLFSLIFVARKEGQVMITTADEKALRNDGKGTSIKLKQAPITLEVGKKISVGEFLPPYDPDLPESFTPRIVRDPNIFDGKWFLVFATQDKGSGVASYAVHESRRMETQIVMNQWVEAESPYVLKDQTLKSFVYVKAVDRAGNERIETMSPSREPHWYNAYLIWGIIGGIGILIFAFGFWKVRKKARRSYV